MTEAVRPSETLAHSPNTTRGNNPDQSLCIHTHLRENLTGGMCLEKGKRGRIQGTMEFDCRNRNLIKRFGHVTGRYKLLTALSGRWSS
jgi:hypothetical protein